MLNRKARSLRTPVDLRRHIVEGSVCLVTPEAATNSSAPGQLEATRGEKAFLGPPPPPSLMVRAFGKRQPKPPGAPTRKPFCAGATGRDGTFARSSIRASRLQAYNGPRGYIRGRGRFEEQLLESPYLKRNSETCPRESTMLWGGPIA